MENNLKDEFEKFEPKSSNDALKEKAMTTNDGKDIVRMSELPHDKPLKIIGYRWETTQDGNSKWLAVVFEGQSTVTSLKRIFNAPARVANLSVTPVTFKAKKDNKDIDVTLEPTFDGDLSAKWGVDFGTTNLTKLMRFIDARLEAGLEPPFIGKTLYYGGKAVRKFTTKQRVDNTFDGWSVEAGQPCGSVTALWRE
jgi:hypothetical protein